MGESLVAVTHECDYPSQATGIAQVTRTNIPAGLASSRIDAAVASTLETTGSLYELDLPLLEKLQPDIILTQRLCDVCAVSFDRVQEAVKGLPSRPAVLNLEPHSLADILDNVQTVGEAVGRSDTAKRVRTALERRIDLVRGKTAQLTNRPRVFCMEWVDPPYCGGHWMKELVDIAGGQDGLAQINRPSQRIEWNQVLEFSPEVMVLTCCGFGLERCKSEGEILARNAGIGGIPAVRARRVFAVDGSAYFSRPGPRIVDSLEILAHLIHPELFPPPLLDGAFAPIDLMRAAIHHD
jgi:iron complex transport system substrate-binding protein